jgi:hypothetical protein
MAILIDTSTESTHALKPYHVFGRSSQHADSLLTANNVSLIHACARWSEQHWTLTDQSRNGSYVNGERLVKDHPLRLKEGDEICFGSLDAASWRVVDVAEPADLLLPLCLGLATITLKAFQNLPDDEHPKACLYRAPNRQWMKETSDGVVPLNDGDLVNVDGAAWRLACTPEPPDTIAASAIIPFMKFQASLDEEHVFLTLARGRSVLELGERTHHYLLLLLARQRLADIALGFDANSQGWIDFDQLVRMLRLDKAHLNIQIFRLRKQFEQAVAQGLIDQDFIERRRGGVRLGKVGIEIVRGSQIEGSWKPDAATRAHA